MSWYWAILWFIAVLMFLIIIHELGHFLTAKWRGVKVLEFGVGMPPRIWGKKYGETIYSINWVPIGGFCKMLGEEDPSESGSLASKSAGTRLLVLSAGSLVMLIFPLIIFSVIYMVPRDVVLDYSSPLKISAVSENSPASEAGVQVDDEILKVAGTEIETVSQLKEITDKNAGNKVPVIFMRGSEEVEVEMLSRPREDWPSGQGAFGITIDLTEANTITEKESDPPWEAVANGAGLYWDTIVTTKDGIEALINQEIPFEVGGVVAGGQVTTEIAKTGDSHDLMFWAGLLSFNLGIVNLLPIPALDGGRIIFVLLEIARRGKRVSPETEGKIHLVGFAMLIAFIIFITFQDIDRIVSGENLLP